MSKKLRTIKQGDLVRMKPHMATTAKQGDPGEFGIVIDPEVPYTYRHVVEDPVINWLSAPKYAPCASILCGETGRIFQMFHTELEIWSTYDG